MSDTMAAVVQFDLKPGSVELREMPIPEIGEDEVLMQVGSVSVCGSDVHQYHGSQSWPVATPVVLGHEFGGVVAKKGVRVRTVTTWLREGRSPTVFIHTPDNADALTLARRFHDDVRARLPGVEPLPEPAPAEPPTLF